MNFQNLLMACGIAISVFVIGCGPQDGSNSGDGSPPPTPTTALSPTLTPTIPEIIQSRLAANDIRMSLEDCEKLAKARTVLVAQNSKYLNAPDAVPHDEFETGAQRTKKIETIERTCVKEKYELLADLNFVLEMPFKLEYDAEHGWFSRCLNLWGNYFPSTVFHSLPLSEYAKTRRYEFELKVGWGYSGSDNFDADDAISRKLNRAFTKRNMQIGDFKINEIAVQGDYGVGVCTLLALKIPPDEARKFKGEYDGRLNIRLEMAPYTLYPHGYEGTITEYLVAIPEKISIVDNEDGTSLLDLEYDSTPLVQKYDIDGNVVIDYYLFPGEKVPFGKGTPWIPVGTTG